MTWLSLVALLAVLEVFVIVNGEVDLTADPPIYGVDCTYPIHWGIDKKQCPYFYDKYNQIMAGCAKLYSKEECDTNERGRLEMSREQAATQHNYTTLGFKKIRAPKEAWQPLIDFYNKYKDRKVLEKWYRGATIVNTWDSPTYMVSFENPDFPGGWTVKDQIWEGVRPIIEEWIGGYKIEPTSLYGIRLYTGGAVLAQHVDRLPLVTSCIINVDQDVDEPWPLEVFDHNGKAYNVTMEPGDLVLYESSTVLHGRPFPMKGRYFANIFVHFKPLIHDELNRLDDEQRILRGEPVAINRRHGRLRTTQGAAAPPNSRPSSDDEIFRIAAARGDMGTVRKLLEKNKELLHKEDENGWQAIHEAIRGAHTEIVKYLVEHGAQLSHKVHRGGSTLWLAKEHLPSNHEIVRFLMASGAPVDHL
eukprot:gene5605-6172_t